MVRRSSFCRREWLKVVAAAALSQLSLSPLSGAEGLPPAALAASASDAGIDKPRFELDQARAAKKQATDDKARAYLGPQQALVVKEHPVDKGALLRRKFRELKQRYSSLYFLPAEIHGRQVLDRARRVVTLTSSVGWEAAAAGRNVYVLGEIFYDQLPGITCIHGLDQLREELRKPATATTELTAEIFVEFVAGMVERGYPGNPFQHDKLYSVPRQHQWHRFEVVI